MWQAGGTSGGGGGSGRTALDDFLEGPGGFTDWADWTDNTTDWGRLTVVGSPAGVGVAAGWPVLADGRGQAFHEYPDWADDNISVQFTATWQASLYASPLAHCVSSATSIKGAVGASYEEFFGGWDLAWIGDTSAAFTIMDLVPDTPPTPGTDYNIEIRSVGGFAALYVDGVHKAGPIPIDAALLGSIRHGLHIQVPSGDADLPRGRILRVLPFTGSLPTMPRPTQRGTATTAEAASASSIDIPYPAGLAAGDLLMAWVSHAGGGSNAIPAGWTQRSSTGATSTLRQLCITKVADGTETGNLTYTKSGGSASAMAGAMVAVDNVNTTTPGIFGGQANTTPSTNLGTAAVSVWGLKRLGVWAGTVLTNDTITVPTGWTEIADSNDTAAGTIHLVVGTKNYDVSPLASTAAGDGTIGASVGSVGFHGVLHPQP